MVKKKNKLIDPKRVKIAQSLLTVPALSESDMERGEPLDPLEYRLQWLKEVAEVPANFNYDFQSLEEGEVLSLRLLGSELSNEVKLLGDIPPAQINYFWLEISEAEYQKWNRLINLLLSGNNQKPLSVAEELAWDSRCRFREVLHCLGNSELSENGELSDINVLSLDNNTSAITKTESSLFKPEHRVAEKLCHFISSHAWVGCSLFSFVTFLFFYFFFSPFSFGSLF